MAPTDMTAKTVVITGASSGIGAAAARALADAGATVAVVGRNPERTAAVAAECVGRARAFVADMSSLESVSALAAELSEAYPTIDVLANNAGFIAAKRAMTVDGIESTIAVNHVAPFLLTRLLEPNLHRSTEARVVTTSSRAHTTGKLERAFNMKARWGSWSSYGDSKLANIAFTAELDRRMHGTTVSAHCFHPGVVHTGFGRDKGLFSKLQNSLGSIFLLTPEKGADTLVFLASAAEPLTTTGRYWARRRLANTSAAGRDQQAAARFWDQTEALVAPHLHRNSDSQHE